MPELVSGTDRTVLGRPEAEEKGPGHALPVDRGGDRPAELRFFEQRALLRVDVGLAGLVRSAVQVKPEELHFQTRPEVLDCEATAPASHAGEVFGIDGVEQVEFSGLKPEGFGISIGNDEESEGVEVGKRL